MTVVRPLAASDVTSWDREVDVVVVGLGAAGAAAAIEAADAGADTLVLEAAGWGGGTSAMSGGLLYLGGGTPIQVECGFDDSADDMFAFLKAACGPEPDEAKVRLFCDDSVDHYHWLVDQGVPFKAQFHPEPGMEPPNDAGLVYSGGEDAWPFDRIARPAPRAHKPQVDGAAGAFLMERLLAAVATRPVTVEHDTAVQRLVTEGTDVVGLVARHDGRDVAVRARGGVVLCAGGFVHDDAMVEQHAPRLAECNLRLGNDHDRGTGIRMAQAAGAAVKRMDAAEVAVPLTPPRELVTGILVNGHGQRFINEDTYYGRVGQEALYHQDGRVYLIVDEDLARPTNAGNRVEWVADSVGELEADIGLPSGSLAATLDLYNRAATHGEDPVFHKARRFVRPLEPPLGAYDFTAERSIYATFTLGGLHTRPEGEVLDLDGEPIPGLYAAGRTTSGVAALGYASGISLADGTYFGRRAGQAAATAAAAPADTRGGPLA